MRIRTKLFVLSATCLGLTLIVSGCDNSTVNESTSTGKEGTGPSTYKDGGAPPQSQKEYYERLQKEKADTSKAAAKKAAAAPAAPKDAPAPKEGETTKP